MHQTQSQARRPGMRADDHYRQRAVRSLQDEYGLYPAVYFSRRYAALARRVRAIGGTPRAESGQPVLLWPRLCMHAQNVAQCVCCAPRRDPCTTIRRTIHPLVGLLLMLLRGRVRALEHRRHPVHAGARLIASAFAVTLALVLIVLPMQAFAFDAASVVRQTIPQARVQGEGELRMYGFHIYDATLFVGPTGLSSTELTTRPFALDLEYEHAFKGAAIAKRGRQEMDELKVASKAQTAQWQEEMETIFPDVQDR